MNGIDFCVVCGDYIPEGQQVCDNCARASKKTKFRPDRAKLRHEETDYYTGKVQVKRNKYRKIEEEE